jgi:hypothetical protein
MGRANLSRELKVFTRQHVPKESKSKYHRLGIVCIKSPPLQAGKCCLEDSPIFVRFSIPRLSCMRLSMQAIKVTRLENDETVAGPAGFDWSECHLLKP